MNSSMNVQVKTEKDVVQLEIDQYEDKMYKLRDSGIAILKILNSSYINGLFDYPTYRSIIDTMIFRFRKEIEILGDKIRDAVEGYNDLYGLMKGQLTYKEGLDKIIIDLIEGELIQIE